jgi:hypothetical protein
MDTSAWRSSRSTRTCRIDELLDWRHLVLSQRGSPTVRRTRTARAL